MWFIVVGVLLLLMKVADFGPVGGWSWLRKTDGGGFREAWRLLQDPGTRARAAAVGERLRSEDGLAVAVTAIEERLPSAAPPA